MSPASSGSQNREEHYFCLYSLLPESKDVCLFMVLLLLLLILGFVGNSVFKNLCIGRDIFSVKYESIFNGIFRSSICL